MKKFISYIRKLIYKQKFKKFMRELELFEDFDYDFFYPYKKGDFI